MPSRTILNAVRSDTERKRVLQEADASLDECAERLSLEHVVCQHGEVYQLPHSLVVISEPAENGLPLLLKLLQLAPEPFKIILLN